MAVRCVMKCTMAVRANGDCICNGARALSAPFSAFEAHRLHLTSPPALRSLAPAPHPKVQGPCIIRVLAQSLFRAQSQPHQGVTGFLNKNGTFEIRPLLCEFAAFGLVKQIKNLAG